MPPPNFTVPVDVEPNDDHIRDAVKDVVAGQRAALNASLRLAVKQDPEKAAKDQALTAQTKLPASAIASDPEGARAVQRLASIDTDALQRSHPEIAAWLANPDNAAVTHDDVPALQRIDVAMRQLQAGPKDDHLGILPGGFRFNGDGHIVEEGPTGTANVYQTVDDLQAELRKRADISATQGGVRDMEAQALDSSVPFLPQVLVGMHDSVQATRAALGTQSPDDAASAASVDQAASDLSPGIGGSIQRGIGGLVADAPLMLTGGPVAEGASALLRLSRARAVLSPYVGKTAAKAAATVATTAAANAPLALREGVQDSRQNGMVHGAIDGLIEGLVPGAFGRTGVERALVPGIDKIGKAGAEGYRAAAKRLLVDTGLEASDEAATELAHAMHEAASGSNPDALKGEQLIPRLVTAGAVGGLAGGAFNLPEALHHKFEHDALAIRQSAREAEALSGAFQEVHAAKLTERSPAKLDEMLQALQERAGTQGATVYAQSEAWDEHWQSRGEDPASAAQRFGVTPEAYDIARASGGQLAIPTGTFLAQSTPEDVKLLEHVTMRPEGMTTAELTTADEALQKHIGEAVASADAQAKQEQDPAAFSADSVGTEVEAQLIAAGTSPDAASQQAKLWSAAMLQLGRRTGADPMDLYRRYNLKIQRETPAVLRNGSKVETLDALIDRLRKGDIPTEKEVRGESLLEFVRKRGITDPGGDFAKLEIDAARKPGDRNLIREDGVDPDTAREAALEAGFELPEDSINGLWAALQEEAAGRPVFRTGEADPGLAAIRDALDHLDTVLRQAGVDPAKASHRDIRRALEQEEGQAYGQPAYHGSPHEFEKFTTDAMGTGEGAQAFGWGLYFAGSKDLAAYYRKKLSENYGVPLKVLRQYFTPGRKIKSYGGHDRVVSFNEGEDGRWSVTVIHAEDAADFDRLQGIIDRAQEHIAAWNAKHPDANNPSFLTDELRYARGSQARLMRTHATPPSAKEVHAAGIEYTPGRLYHVEIPDDHEYLLWDKPLTEHPEAVREKVRAVYAALGLRDPMLAATPKTGERAYKDIAHAISPNPDDPMSGHAAMSTGGEAASKTLLAAGVPGIKFLDGASRAKGEGSHNYVIFDDSRVTVTKYEQPKRGQISIGRGKSLSITLFKGADLSTFLHETGHAYLEILSDLATEKGAQADVVADMDVIRKWLGNEGGAFTEEQHETFARGFESYLMSGKAPSAALRSAFATFKGWLATIYRTLVNLRVELTPEVRSVFDRMLASEEEIQNAGTLYHAVAMSPEAMGLSPQSAAYAAYVQSVEEAKQRGEDQVRAEIMESELVAVRRARADEMTDVIAEVTDQVNGRPEFVALRALQDNVMPAGVTLPEGTRLKLDRGDLVALYGEDALKRLPGPRVKGEKRPNSGNRVYANEGGMDVATAARLFGFRDSDALWEALVNAPDRKGTIVAEANAEMLRRHPDPLTDGTIQESASAALAGELAGEVLVREVRALATKTGGRVAPTEVMREAARDHIQRTKARDLRPAVYERAAAKASKEAFEAAARLNGADGKAKSELEAIVYEAKQRQLFSLHLFRAARDAKAAGEAGRAYTRSFDTREKREKIGKAGGWEWTIRDSTGAVVEVVDNVGEAKEKAAKQPGATYERTNGYLEQSDAILEGYDLRRASTKALRRRESLQAWINRQTEAGEPVDIAPAVIEDLGRRNWSDLTVGEQAAIVDALKNVEHLAGLKNKLMKQAQKRRLEEARTAIVGAVTANGRTVAKRKVSETYWEKFRDSWDRFFEAHRKDAFLAREMDGFKDGGPVQEILIRPRTEAANAEAELAAAAAKHRDAVFKEWSKKGGVTRQDIPGTRMRLTLEDRIGMAELWGSAEGRQRVLMDLKASGFGEQDVLAVIDSLDEADWKLVNATHAQLESYWSDVKALEQRTRGLVPEKVQALTIPTRFGVQPGGYVPIRYNQRRSTKPGDVQAATEAKEQLRAANASNQTRHSHTKLRAKDVEGLAVRYDFGVIGQGINEVIHDLTHREMMIDQNRILRDKEIAKAMIDHYGRGALDQFVTTAADIAVGDAPGRAAVIPIARAIRMNSAPAVFAFNLTSALGQLTGVTQSMVRVGGGRMAWAVARMMRDATSQESAFRWVQGKSSYMRTRSLTMLREMAEAGRRVEATSKLDDLKRWGYFPMTKVQQVVDTTTWMAAYDQGMAAAHKAGKTVEQAEADAIAHADQTVIDTQGSGRIGDLAAIQRGGDLAKLFTTFYSYFSVTYNLQRESIQQFRGSDKGVADTVKLATDFLLIYALPAVLTGLIKDFLSGTDDEHEDRWARAAKDEITYGLGMLVGVREISGAVSGFAGYSGPAGLRGLDLANKLVTQAMQGTADKGLLKAGLGMTGLLGVPALEAQRLVDAWTIADEEGGGAALRAALFGKPRR